MSISWNNTLSIAEARLRRMTGQKRAGAFSVRLDVEFTVSNWMQPRPFPIVLFLPSLVTVTAPGSLGLILGKALPDVPISFSVGEHSSGVYSLGFELALSPGAMEAIEEVRNGDGLTITIALQAEVRRGDQVGLAHDQAQATFTVSDWLKVLEDSGYGRSMLFEIPIPESASGEAWTKLLSGARTHLLKGHYAQAVGDCRLVLEALTEQLSQGKELSDALAQRSGPMKHDLTLDQRELILRQAARDYCSLAHHVDRGVPGEIYDRRSAQMMVATAAVLVSSALSRQSASR